MANAEQAAGSHQAWRYQSGRRAEVMAEIVRRVGCRRSSNFTRTARGFPGCRAPSTTWNRALHPGVLCLDDFHRPDPAVDGLAGLQCGDGPAVARGDLVVGVGDQPTGLSLPGSPSSSSPSGTGSPWPRYRPTAIRRMPLVPPGNSAECHRQRRSPSRGVR
jgi:hypothetical protein